MGGKRSTYLISNHYNSCSTRFQTTITLVQIFYAPPHEVQTPGPTLLIHQVAEMIRASPLYKDEYYKNCASAKKNHFNRVGQAKLRRTSASGYRRPNRLVLDCSFRDSVERQNCTCSHVFAADSRLARNFLPNLRSPPGSKRGNVLVYPRTG